jgi:hypothetical protein
VSLELDFFYLAVGCLPTTMKRCNHVPERFMRAPGNTSLDVGWEHGRP